MLPPQSTFDADLGQYAIFDSDVSPLGIFDPEMASDASAPPTAAPQQQLMLMGCGS